ncbi:SLC13 family permease, partial [Pediococcus damnosus]|uniref:SLC13 family permease n=1 Tax=Pediococcus damnosus TaxID=51663 RepID=UPI00215AA81E
MTIPMIITIAITVVMIVLIMMDKLPFGAPPLLACLLLVIFGITDIPGAFAGFANSTIVMLAEFMAIIAALERTSMIAKFKGAMFNLASKGGFRAYILIILIVMLFCSLFGTGSTAFYVLTIGILSTLPYSKKLPTSKILMPAGFAANHPLIPFNTALQYGILIAVLKSAGVTDNISILRFVVINVFLSAGFLVNCLLQYKFLPDHPINKQQTEENKAAETQTTPTLPKWKENIVYLVFIMALNF